MEKPEKITTAFLLNNDLNKVEKSFEKVFKVAERHHQEIHDWHFCKADMSQIYFLIKALKTVKNKVVKSFTTSIEYKSPTDQQKRITELNRALYFPDKT